jgi:flagellar basal-body rod modification protein FlgD
MVDITRVSGINNLNTSTTSGVRVPKTDTSTTGGANGAQNRAEELQTQFLKILLTQMQNQNPTDPMDTKEFTGQLAQFSSLEQQITTNSKLDQLVESIGANASTAAFGYIGQTAELGSNLTSLENNAADWKYALNGNADKINIKIKDEQGRVVFEKSDRNIQAGTYSLNALKSDFTYPVENGQVLKLEITATNQQGAKVRTETSTSVKVDGVESGPDGIELRSGNLLFNLGDVKRFRSQSTAPTTV